MRIPSRPFAAPIRQQKVSARRNVPARTIAPDTNEPLDLPLLPIESSPISQSPLPQQHQAQAQETLGKSNLLRSRKLKDRLISQQLMGEYDRHLGDAVRTLRTNVLSRLPNLHGLLTLVEGNTIKALDVLKTAAEQALHEGVADESVVLKNLTSDVRAHQRKIARARARGVAAGSTNPAAGNSRRRTNLLPMYSGTAITSRTVLVVIEILLNEIETRLNEQEEAVPFTVKLQQKHNFIIDEFAALAPAASQRQIRTLVHGINILRHIAVLLRDCQHLLGRMRGKNPALKIEPVKFLQELLRLSAAGWQIDQTQEFATQIGGSQLKHKLSFLNALRPMLRDWPILLWQDLEKRRNALGNLRELMTQLTDLELQQGVLD